MINARTAVINMEAVEHILVSLPDLVPTDPQSVQNFRTQIALQVQGDPVVFDAKMPLSALALGFTVAYEVATQAFLQLEDGRKVLVFDHETRDLMQSETIDETVWSEVLKLKNKVISARNVATPTPETIIDLGILWNRTKEQDDIIIRTKFFMKNFVQNLSPSLTLRLLGDIPALPLLAAVYLARPAAYTVEYADPHSGMNVMLFA